MNERDLALLAIRIRPRWISRRRALNLAVRVHRPFASIAWAMREPRLWWFCRRMGLHRRFGLPMPAKPPYRVEV